MLTVALIGFGRMGKMHYQTLSSLKNIEVKYIIDDTVEPLSLDNFPQHTRHSLPRLKRTVDLPDVLSDKSIDAVIICTSSEAHVSLIQEALKHNKAIFCEKPVSFNLDTLQELKKDLAEHTIKCQVGLNRRFDPDFLALRHRLHAGEIGKTHIIKITNRDPRRPDPQFIKKSGGLFYDFNTHDFDMIHFLTGRKVSDVFVMGDALIDPKLKTLYDIDTAIITLKLDDDSLVVIDTSRETNFGYDQRIEVFGQNGMLRVDNVSESTLQMVNTLGETHALPYWSFVERYKDAYRGEFLAFIDYVTIPNSQSPASIDDMIKSVRVANMVEKAFKENAPVHSNV
jgi:myo-inositol 2-dehydrogenase/D-chiro-inositol 1-dehydrogenase